MRELSEKEKEIVSTIVAIKQNSDLDELQGSKILKKFVPIIFMRWKSDNENSWFFLYKKSKNEHKLFDLMDFIFFLEELERNNMIKLIKMNEDKEDKPFYELYDKERYFVDEIHCFSIPNDNKKYPRIFEKDLKTKAKCYLKASVDKNYIKSFVDTFEKYIGGAIIYPLPLLEDYVKDYKTIEGRMFDKQQNISYLAVAIAILGLIISLLIPQCSDTKIDEELFSIILKGLENTKSII